MTSKKRRSKFEICLEIIELCQIPGIPLTLLARDSRVNWAPLKDILSALVSGEIIKTEIRPLSPTGHKRKTEYYIRTAEGDNVLIKFKEIEKRISISGSPSG